MLILTKKLILNNKYRMQWEPAQNRYVLLFSEGMVELNESSVDIIRHCDGSKTGEEIITVLENEYEDEHVRDDIVNFLKDAGNYGWIINIE